MATLANGNGSFVALFASFVGVAVVLYSNRVSLILLDRFFFSFGILRLHFGICLI